jgi:hypothetical protein
LSELVLISAEDARLARIGAGVTAQRKCAPWASKTGAGLVPIPCVVIDFQAVSFTVVFGNATDQSVPRAWYFPTYFVIFSLVGAKNCYWSAIFIDQSAPDSVIDGYTETKHLVLREVHGGAAPAPPPTLWGCGAALIPNLLIHSERKSIA